MTSKVEAYCACGGAVKGAVSSREKNKAQKVITAFRLIHTMEGCQPCDAETARKARRKQEETER